MIGGWPALPAKSPALPNTAQPTPPGASSAVRVSVTVTVGRVPENWRTSRVEPFSDNATALSAIESASTPGWWIAAMSTVTCTLPLSLSSAMAVDDRATVATRTAPTAPPAISR